MSKDSIEKEKKLSFKNICIGIIVFFIAIGVIVAIKDEKTESTSYQERYSQKEGVSGEEVNPTINYTDITDFEYEIKDNSINLKRYKGKSKKILINDTYNIEGTDYTVTNIEHSIFNGSQANILYIPKTISCVYDDTLAYLSADHIDLYYAGTQEEWNNIFKEYEASSVKESASQGDYEGAGEALASKVNSAIGHKYDASKFTYYFQSTLENIK